GQSLAFRLHFFCERGLSSLTLNRLPGAGHKRQTPIGAEQLALPLVVIMIVVATAMVAIGTTTTLMTTTTIMTMIRATTMTTIMMRRGGGGPASAECEREA